MRRRARTRGDVWQFSLASWAIRLGDSRILPKCCMDLHSDIDIIIIDTWKPREQQDGDTVRLKQVKTARFCHVHRRVGAVGESDSNIFRLIFHLLSTIFSHDIFACTIISATIWIGCQCGSKWFHSWPIWLSSPCVWPFQTISSKTERLYRPS